MFTAIASQMPSQKNITEKNSQLEKIEKKYLLDEIDKERYTKHASKIKAEIAELTKSWNTSEINSSNLEKAVEKCYTIYSKYKWA